MGRIDHWERWWRTPLQVERLAWSAATDATDAAQRLSRSRGSEAVYSTEPVLVASAYDAVNLLRLDGRPVSTWSSLSGFHATKDGWIRMHANYPHHASAILRAFGTEDRGELTTRLRWQTTRQAVGRIRAQGGVATPVNSPEEWALDPHDVVTRDQPWVSVSETGDRPGLTADEAPLAGVRVLDLTRVIAGPTCSQLLACLGAEVLRVDPPRRAELLAQYVSNGMGKRSVELDLAHHADLLADVLLPGADVVLHGYRPGSLEPYGLEPEQILEADPSKIVGSLSAWGETGPMGRSIGFDSVVQAATGIATVCGTEDEPGALPVQALDHSTGLRLATEIMGLLERRRGGCVQASLLGAARRLLSWGTREPEDRLQTFAPVLVEVTTSHGTATLPPPPMMRDGRTLELPIRDYGGSVPRWECRTAPGGTNDPIASYGGR